MKTCRDCRFFGSNYIGTGKNNTMVICKKCHPCLANYPICRDFIALDELNKGVKDFIAETIKSEKLLQPIEYLYVGLLRQGSLGLTELPKENNYRRIEMGRYDWMRNGLNMFNATEIEYPPATKAWGMVTHFGIFDSPNNGCLIVSGDIQQPTIIKKDQVAHFEIANMKVSLNN